MRADFVWVPCILHVVFISSNFIFQGPCPTIASITGAGRLSAWLAIAGLISDASRK